MNFDGWARSLKLLFLEGVSVGGSILLIALFSGIPFCRRRMFGIKGQNAPNTESSAAHEGVRRFFAFSRRQGDGIVTGKSEGNHLALSAVCGKISRNIDSCRREGHPRRRGEREA